MDDCHVAGCDNEAPYLQNGHHVCGKHSIETNHNYCYDNNLKTAGSNYQLLFERSFGITQEDKNDKNRSNGKY